ncbi:hypothetical protein [Paenibacillus sp. Mc5Re-14]|uniref:hypothetical protein n=1 Tax=Paenibacillus sp. Mc5Re-14 TaxID=1030529 RepID=UPI000A4003F4|nr:hypothetical protein [Paenibacillus sp. Mc5Re-14]
MKKYTEYSSTREYLKDKFELKRKWPRFKKTITLEKLEFIKTTLKKEHSLIELGTIKSDIEGEFEQHKSVASIAPMIAIVITILGIILSNNNNARNRISDQTSRLIEKVRDVKLETLPHDQKLSETAKYAKDDLDTLLTPFLLTYSYSYIFYILGFTVLVLAYYFYSSTKTIASLNTIIAQSYEEKKAEEEENKDRQDKQEQSEKALKEKELKDARAIFERKRIRRPNNLKK